MSPFYNAAEMPQYGWDWAMMPTEPEVAAEMRQSFAQAKVNWLEQWQPKAEH